MHEDYYLKQEKKLVRNFVRLTHRNKIFLDMYCNGSVNSIQDKTINNFKMLLPELPYHRGQRKLLNIELFRCLTVIGLD